MLEEVKNIIKGEVGSGEKELASHSRDASIFEIKPKLVVYPKDSEDIKKFFKKVEKKKKKKKKKKLKTKYNT